MTTAILGYGKMGRGIFSLLTGAGRPVIVYVRSEEKAAKNNQQQEKRVQRALRAGEIDAAGAERLRGAARFTSNLADLGACGLAIETISEDLAQKCELLRRIEGCLAADALVTTNTSMLPVAELAGALRARERFCGLHFFHPTQLSTIVELILWDGVSAGTVARLDDFIRSIDRTPIHLRDAPGSPVNHILANFYCEGLYIVEQGLALPSEVDRLAGTFCRIGPCESLDAVGVSFFTGSFDQMAAYRPPGVTTPGLLYRLRAEGRDGRAAGRGIFLYEQDRARDDDPAWYRDPGQTHSRPGAAGDSESLRLRLLYSLCCGMLFEAQRGTGSVEDLSRAVAEVLLMDFSPLAFLRERGAARRLDEVRALETQVGVRFPSALLSLVPE
jgi:3-hydroxybutyryl-CoA dehydrogenase